MDTDYRDSFAGDLEEVPGICIFHINCGDSSAGATWDMF